MFVIVYKPYPPLCCLPFSCPQHIFSWIMHLFWIQTWPQLKRCSKKSGTCLSCLDYLRSLLIVQFLLTVLCLQIIPGWFLGNSSWRLLITIAIMTGRDSLIDVGTGYATMERHFQVAQDLNSFTKFYRWRFLIQNFLF